MLIRVVDGVLKRGEQIKMISNGSVYTVDRVGIFTPKKVDVPQLSAGEIGFICANIRQISDCNIGDTLVSANDKVTLALPGFKKVKPAVFSAIYPVEPNRYPELKDALEKLCLNDSSIEYECESSAALGFGFRCGFLGLLHMSVTQERLEREFNVDLVTTAPGVIYKVYMRDGSDANIHNPADFPDYSMIDRIEEPIAKVSILVQEQFVGDVISLCVVKRGIQKDMNFISSDRVMLIYHIPLAEIIFDFHDRIKSISKGYASFEWELDRYEESDIVKVNVLINGDSVDALSMMTHRSKSESRGRSLCLKLKELIPKQLFAVPVQAAIGGKIIARETVPATRKDVTAKCYGGDISRKRKLLDKQKKGKKRMKMLGNVEIPQSAFLAVLKVDEE